MGYLFDYFEHCLHCDDATIKLKFALELSQVAASQFD
jgi:hypothetical protein